MTAPQVVGEDHNSRRGGAVILVSEGWANLRVHAVRFKEAFGDADSCQIHRPISVTEDRRVSAVSGHALEASAALAPIVEAAGADVSEVRLNARLITHAAPVAPLDSHQTVRIFVGQRFENDAVEDAEDRSV